MELWIRSQNKEKLVKVNDLNLYDSNILKNDFILTKEDEKDYSKIMIIANDNVNLGTYKKERALEILDDISKQIKNVYLIEIKPLMKPEYREKVEKDLNTKYHGEFIMEPPATTIKPINSNIIFYEMPLE